MDLDRDTAPVVLDFHDIAGKQPDRDVGAVSGHRLVDRVVHDLPDQMVQPLGRGATDIHARALTHRIKSFEYLNGLRAVV